MEIASLSNPVCVQGAPLPASGVFRSAASRIWKTSAGGPILFCLLFAGMEFSLRLALLAKSAADLNWHPSAVAGAFLVGTAYDLVTASYCAMPLALALLCCPAKWHGRWTRGALRAFFAIATFVLLFKTVAEWLFWDEFGARFNFIAVDYLVYTNEVLGNIRESYPLPLIFGTLFAATVLGFALILRFSPLRLWLGQAQPGRWLWRERFVSLSPFLAAPIAFTLFVNGRQVPAFGNAYNQELARNGLYSLFAEFRNNELNFEQFYDTVPANEAFTRAREAMRSKDARFLSDAPREIARAIVHPGPEKRWNVIQITVESLSSEFMGTFGSTNGLTPNLDAIAAQSLFFTNFYATGTRTVRGMEALTLGLPPTPGQSIVRRPHNEHLFSLGSVFRAKGYDTAFLYGGYGYFDNMNYFFSNNGYRVVDRASVPATNITFANVWGVCDEDLFDWSLKEADTASQRGQPFFQFVMTTSNHRPYTYPGGRIDIPSHSGREGGVKYTDYAIGRFLEKARTREWFANTLFVIVADHCAASAGRADLPIERFEIPLMIYNPSLVAPRTIGTLCSQIDYPPTLLSLLNWSYRSKFFGKDILLMRPEEQRAYIASYQKLGLLTTNRLAVLQPVRSHAVYSWNHASTEVSPISDPGLIQDCVAAYQSASLTFRDGLYGEFAAH